MSLSKSEGERQSWLLLLFEAYSIIDRSVSEAISEEEKKGKQLACLKGCFHCCRTHREIPVYPHELTGIYWFVLERLPVSLKEILSLQLLNFKKGDPCPFLIDGICSIHHVRPAACRLFNVFNRPCSMGEDPYYTRREDVLIPPRKYLQKAFLKILPFYNIKAERDVNLVENFIRSQAIPLQSINWKALGRRLREKGGCAPFAHFEL